jgi:hypothetical protein
MASLNFTTTSKSAKSANRFDIGTAAFSEFQKPVDTAKVVWILGKSHTMEIDWREDFNSITWCSYRRNFPQMEPYPITSDSGWGCMLRASQMIMAQGVKMHKLGRNWKPGSLIYNRKSKEYCSLVRLFVDQPGEQYLYSIHNMCGLGLAKHDKLPGEWYGPSAAAYVLKGLSEVGRCYQGSGLGMIVAGSGVVYLSEIENMASESPSDVKLDNSAYNFQNELLDKKNPNKSSSSSKHISPPTKENVSGSGGGGSTGGTSSDDRFDPLFNPPISKTSSLDPLSAAVSAAAAPSTQHVKHSISSDRKSSKCDKVECNYNWNTNVVILIPVRLGLQSLNEQYYPALLKMLEISQSLGFIGGWPNHAV